MVTTSSSHTNDSFEGKVAIVTGSSAGIGFRIAQKLLERGAQVYINSRTETSGNEAIVKLRSISPRVKLITGDCSNYSDIRRVIQCVFENAGAVDLLVSAGAESTVPPKPFAEMTSDELVSAFSSRFYSKLFPVHAALPFLKIRGGAIVMLNTDAARHPTFGESIVGAAGAALIMLTKTLAKECSRLNVRVNSVCLTLTSDTPSWDRIFSAETFQKELFEKLLSKFPSGLAPTAEEVARVALFLVSNESAQVTGQTISVNGGLSYGGW